MKLMVQQQAFEKEVGEMLRLTEKRPERQSYCVVEPIQRAYSHEHAVAHATATNQPYLLRGKQVCDALACLGKTRQVDVGLSFVWKTTLTKEPWEVEDAQEATVVQQMQKCQPPKFCL